MGEKRIIFFIGILIIAFIGFASADYNLGTPAHEINTNYEPGEKVSGWISIQLSNESNSTLFEDSEANSMTLLELINENPDFSYSVNSTYGTLDTENYQNLSLDNGFFYLPGTEGIITYQFNFSGQEIFSEEIQIALSTADLNQSLNNTINALNNIKTKIDSYDLFEQRTLNYVLKIDKIESKLTNLSLAYKNATTEAELNDIAKNLSLIKIPKTITITKKAIEIPIFVAEKKVDLDAVKNITNTTYEANKTSRYKNAIIGWNVNNLDLKLSFKEFSGIYNDSTEVLANVLELEINKKTTIDYPAYIFLEKMNDTLFKQDYKKQEQENHYVFEFTGQKEVLGFSTTESINLTKAPFFISPALTELGIEDFDYEEGKPGEKTSYEKKNLTIFILAICFVLILGFILYVVLQTWYKRRYENYLFENKNDLYNLANYIAKCKKRRLDNHQIQENLKNASWSSEQIRYALKKYTGKRTGMYEIAVRKTLERREKKDALKRKRHKRRYS